jgi:hypothetical protein
LYWPVLKLLFWSIVVFIAALAWLAWATLRPAAYRRRIANARADFDKRRNAYCQQFLAAASATGKPRGLAWKQCDFQDKMLLARDRATGQLVALVGATISFSAIEGGGMEEVEAVGNLRAATAVFNWNGRQWTTDGRAVFNLEPREVLDRYKDSLDPVAG